jgi:hypothetical protein
VKEDVDGRDKPGHDECMLLASRIDTVRNFSSSFLLTGYLPVSSRAHLPAFLMRVPKKPRLLACIISATPINSAAT